MKTKKVILYGGAEQLAKIKSTANTYGWKWKIYDNDSVCLSVPIDQIYRLFYLGKMMPK